uniref:Fucosyltransferase n=1 Tax=Acrobeloides nanus TaxID=290746 RepID=A0A914C0Z1_9BILA
MAEHLKFLIENPNEYIKYFSWTQQFYKPILKASYVTHHRTLCKLCQLVSTNVTKQIKNLEE